MKWYHRVDWSAVSIALLLIISVIGLVVLLFKGCL